MLAKFRWKLQAKIEKYTELEMGIKLSVKDVGLQ